MIFLSRFSLTKRYRHRKNDIFNLSVCLNDCHKNQQTQGNHNKKIIAYINLLSFGVFFIIVASIVLRQLVLQEIW